MENIRMRLSAETKIILKEIQADFYEKFGLKVTYTTIIEQSIRTAYTDMKQIDWKELKNKEMAIASNANEELYNYMTSFYVSEEILEELAQIQIFLKETFETKRIYRAFAIRLSVRRYYEMNFK